MKEKRFDVAGENTEADFNRLGEMIEGVSTHFICNVDEIRHQEWPNRSYQPHRHS
jgi:hypothetical protein